MGLAGMSAEVKSIVPHRERAIASAGDTLRSAIAEGFENVVVIGIRVDRTSAVMVSTGCEALQVLGGLELAKWSMLQHVPETVPPTG